SPVRASSSARTEDSRPTTKGAIMCGKITISRMGIIGSLRWAPLRMSRSSFAITLRLDAHCVGRMRTPHARHGEIVRASGRVKIPRKVLDKLDAMHGSNVSLVRNRNSALLTERTCLERVRLYSGHKE